MQSAPVSAVIHTPSPRKSSMPQNTPNCEFCLLFSFVAQLFHCILVEKDFSAFALQLIPFLWKILEPSNISITSRVSERVRSDQIIIINFVPVLVPPTKCANHKDETLKNNCYNESVSSFKLCHSYISVHLKKKLISKFHRLSCNTIACGP